ncbi:nucleotidyltransferase family protein [Candidatus Villigracilis affinis]|uniref:nucleotidyltransferase family protein n=1 Tax=Candidatus Villigracilis affinis TaxID=3140682 RepID=UPI002A2113DB|nr:nucleotidyltransferase family protein [Anaerolineales bacterium]
MDAIVTAGGVPLPGDPLYVYSNGNSKALIDISGKPMVQWVLDALGESKKVDNVIVIGLSPKSGLTCKKPLHYISNQGRMLANIVTGVNKSLELNKKNEYVLIVSSDIPAIKGDMVDWLINTSMETKDDLYYGVCPREVMETRYPTSKRTYTKLKEMELCGADINVIHVSMTTDHLDTWEQLIGNRKSPLRQAAVIGWDTLFQLATRQFTLQGLVERASQRIGIKGRAIVWDKAEPCMDVDKPHQLELMREDIASQLQKAAKAEKKAATAAKKVTAKPVAAKPKPKAKANNK